MRPYQITARRSLELTTKTYLCATAGKPCLPPALLTMEADKTSKAAILHVAGNQAIVASCQVCGLLMSYHRTGKSKLRPQNADTNRG